MTKKYKYQVKDGRFFGAFRQYGPGSIVELTEEEADGFLDVVFLLKGEPEPVSKESQIKHLSSLSKEQLKALPEYEAFENPKPKTKDEILGAILNARGLVEKKEAE